MNKLEIAEKLREIHSMLNRDDSQTIYAVGYLLDAAFSFEPKSHYEKLAGYELSDNQYLFCIDAELQELDLNFDYSGRGMFGETCPSVTTKEGFKSESSYKVDSMGLSKVYYAEY